MTKTPKNPRLVLNTPQPTGEKIKKGLSKPNVPLYIRIK